MVRTVEMLGKNGNCKLTDTELRRLYGLLRRLIKHWGII